MASDEAKRLRDDSARAIQARDLEGAAELLEALVALEPGDAIVPKKLARVYLELARPQEALSALVRAADAYVASGLVIQAIAVCKWILELDPLHTSTLERLAELHAAAAPRPAGVAHTRRGAADESHDSDATDESDETVRLDAPHGSGNSDAPGRSDTTDGPGTTDGAGTSKAAPREQSRAPLEELMLTEIVQPESLGSREGVREIAIDERELETPAPQREAASPERQAAARRLVATPLFGRLGVKALRRLIDAARLVRLREGEVLFRQGDPADALYVVAEGAVVPIAEGETRRKLSVLEAGEFFGEIALVADQPRNATVEALVASELLAIDRSVIRELLDEEPEMLAVLLRFLRQRLVDRLLRTSELFARMDPQTRAHLARSFRLMEAQAGATLIQQGRPVDSLHLVLAGALRVLVRDDSASNEEEKEIAVLGAGDPCGEMSLLDEAPAMASVVAARKSWVLLLPRQELETILASQPALGEHLAALAQARRRDLAERSDLELV